MNNSHLVSTSFSGNHVKNTKDEDLGKVVDLVIDTNRGATQYAVLSVRANLGIGEKLIAIPFDRLKVDSENQCMILDADKQRLKDAPGFDKDKWPNFSDASFKTTHDTYYQ